MWTGWVSQNKLMWIKGKQKIPGPVSASCLSSKQLRDWSKSILGRRCCSIDLSIYICLFLTKQKKALAPVMCSLFSGKWDKRYHVSNVLFLQISARKLKASCRVKTGLNRSLHFKIGKRDLFLSNTFDPFYTRRLFANHHTDSRVNRLRFRCYWSKAKQKCFLQSVPK